jgi:hypothetical protein
MFHWQRARDRMVVGITTTYATSAYHQWCCEIESPSGRGAQHCVIKLASEFTTGRWFSLGAPVSSIWPPRYNWNIVESGVNTLNP